MQQHLVESQKWAQPLQVRVAGESARVETSAAATARSREARVERLEAAGAMWKRTREGRKWEEEESQTKAQPHWEAEDSASA